MKYKYHLWIVLFYSKLKSTRFKISYGKKLIFKKIKRCPCCIPVIVKKSIT